MAALLANVRSKDIASQIALPPARPERALMPLHWPPQTHLSKDRSRLSRARLYRGDLVGDRLFLGFRVQGRFWRHEDGVHEIPAMKKPT